MRMLIYDTFVQITGNYDKLFNAVILILCMYYFILKPLIIKPFIKKAQKVKLKTNDFEANFENTHPLLIMLFLLLGKSKEKK